MVNVCVCVCVCVQLIICALFGENIVKNLSLFSKSN